MSNYLDSLVAKSLGLAKGVVPRPLSLYEPLPFVAVPAAPDGNSLVDDPFEQTPARPEPVRHRSLPLGPKAKSEKQPASSRERQSGATLISYEAGMLAIPAENAAKPVEQSGLELPASQQPVASQVVTNKEEQPISPEAATPADRPTTGPRGVVRFIPGEEALEGPGTVPTTAPSRTLLVTPVTPRPAADHERKSSLPESTDGIPLAAEAGHEHAPTVKITIGRVDVRAVLPERPAPRPTRERANPALSLEEYLKQRSGGKP